MLHDIKENLSYLTYRLVSVFLVLICVGTIFHFNRPRGNNVVHTLNDELFDEKAFQTDIYSGRISRIIRNSNVKYQEDSVNRKHHLNEKETTEKELFKPRCVGSLTEMPISNYSDLSMKDVEMINTDVKFGGFWEPPDCTSQHRVAIIIPYRDRYSHLIQLLAILVPILKQQNINFNIYVTEQVGKNTFNKGVLMNAAFKEALKEEHWQCFVFQDVDLIPENVRNMYTCPWQPRHMSASVDEFAYRLPVWADGLVGGVFAIKTDHFRKVNGYSNRYWGWGAEDDDMTMRLFKNGFRIDRPPYNVARYNMVKHTKATKNKYRWVIMKKNRRDNQKDGLNSLNYTLANTIRYPLYTNFHIDVGLPPKLWYFPKS